MEAILLGNESQPETYPINGIQIPNQISSDPVVLIDAPVVPVSQNSSIFVNNTYYVHAQSIPSNIWEVYHNLRKHPSIHIEDISGNEVIAEIVHVDNNHARILFEGNWTGNAYCS